MTAINIISWIHRHTQQTVVLYPVSIRLSLRLSEKKINRDISNVLSSESQHNLQWRSFSGKPLYRTGGNLSLN